MLDVIDASTLRRWAVVTRAALAARRAEIDALNVYPVPDGDTGTNLYLTLDEALDTVRNEHERRGILGTTDLVEEATAMSRASLLAARGNSGVILSQLIRGLSEVIAGAGSPSVGAQVVAEGLTRAAERARASVMRPQEGTILTVADVAASTASALAEAGESLAVLTERTVEAARDALAKTPEQLQVLRDAGVVDAGGAGYLLFLEALDRVVRDRAPLKGYAVDEFTLNLSFARRDEWAAEPGGAWAEGSKAAEGDDSPHFEVMYLLDGSDEERVEALSTRLDELGDSVVISSSGHLWSVHVHVDDIGAALEAGMEAGRPHRVQVNPLAPALRPRPRIGVAVVATAAGPGIGELFAAEGATVVESGPARRASAGQLLEAVRATGAAEVILLPNDKDTLMAAEAAAQAAGQEGQEVHVVHSTTAVQGIAALAVYEAGRSARHNVVSMTRSAAATRHGAVTIAVKSGLTSGGVCEVGDVLGVVRGDITIVGDDFTTVALQVVDALSGGGAELLTLVTGQNLPDGVIEAITAHVRDVGRGLEIEMIDGGQPAYPLLIGVE